MSKTKEDSHVSVIKQYILRPGSPSDDGGGGDGDSDSDINTKNNDIQKLEDLKYS